MSNTSQSIILHIPHSCLEIPKEDQIGFIKSKYEILDEVNKLNDHHTNLLFHSEKSNVIPLVFPVNRFLVDVERYEYDEHESMSKLGMGVLYTHDTEGKRFRYDLTKDAREQLLNKYYRPHHKKLKELVERSLSDNDVAVIIDCHSFPDYPLPCDSDQDIPRPDICLGTDAFHTPNWLRVISEELFVANGYEVEFNRPYSGTLVPLDHYEKNEKVLSLMIEINRRLYLDGTYQLNNEAYNKLNSLINLLYEQISKFLFTLKMNNPILRD
jgi:N-formylglutamate amidohydrolase